MSPRLGAKHGTQRLVVQNISECAKCESAINQESIVVSRER